MDVSAKQRLCLETYVVTFGGLGGGFAPRHLRRWAAFCISLDVCKFPSQNISAWCFDSKMVLFSQGLNIEE